jgi:hypothetical protein
VISDKWISVKYKNESKKVVDNSLKFSFNSVLASGKQQKPVQRVKVSKNFNHLNTLAKN